MVMGQPLQSRHEIRSSQLLYSYNVQGYKSLSSRRSDWNRLGRRQRIVQKTAHNEHFHVGLTRRNSAADACERIDALHNSSK